MGAGLGIIFVVTCRFVGRVVMFSVSARWLGVGDERCSPGFLGGNPYSRSAGVWFVGLHDGGGDLFASARADDV